MSVFVLAHVCLLCRAYICVAPCTCMIQLRDRLIDIKHTHPHTHTHTHTHTHPSLVSLARSVHAVSSCVFVCPTTGAEESSGEIEGLARETRARRGSADCFGSRTSVIVHVRSTLQFRCLQPVLSRPNTPQSRLKRKFLNSLRHPRQRHPRLDLRLLPARLTLLWLLLG